MQRIRIHEADGQDEKCLSIDSDRDLERLTLTPSNSHGRTTGVEQEDPPLTPQHHRHQKTSCHFAASAFFGQQGVLCLVKINLQIERGKELTEMEENKQSRLVLAILNYKTLS